MNEAPSQDPTRNVLRISFALDVEDPDPENFARQARVYGNLATVATNKGLRIRLERRDNIKTIYATGTEQEVLNTLRPLVHNTGHEPFPVQLPVTVMEHGPSHARASRTAQRLLSTYGPKATGAEGLISTVQTTHFQRPKIR